VVTAAWKTESNRRGVRTPSGRSQKAGAVRRCDVSRLRLWGFPRVVRSEDAVPSILSLLVCAKCEDSRCLPRRVLLICVGLQRSQKRREKVINRHREAAVSFADCRDCAWSRDRAIVDGWCCRAGAEVKELGRRARTFTQRPPSTSHARDPPLLYDDCVQARD
jgi:hypothetical protein